MFGVLQSKRNNLEYTMEGKMGKLSLEGESEAEAKAAMKTSMVNEAKVRSI